MESIHNNQHLFSFIHFPTAERTQIKIRKSRTCLLFVFRVRAAKMGQKEWDKQSGRNG